MSYGGNSGTASATPVMWHSRVAGVQPIDRSLPLSLPLSLLSPLSLLPLSPYLSLPTSLPLSLPSLSPFPPSPLSLSLPTSLPTSPSPSPLSLASLPLPFLPLSSSLPMLEFHPVTLLKSMKLLYSAGQVPIMRWSGSPDRSNELMSRRHLLVDSVALRVFGVVSYYRSSCKYIYTYRVLQLMPNAQMW